MKLVLAVLALLATPAAADNPKFNWEGLPETAPEMRTKFDEALASMYNDDCECILFIHRGEIAAMELPLSDSDRLTLYEAIRRTMIHPLTRDRES